MSDAHLMMAVGVLKYFVCVNAVHTFQGEMRATPTARGQDDGGRLAVQQHLLADAQDDSGDGSGRDSRRELIQGKGNWSAVGEDVDVVTGSSQLGVAMFGFALHEHRMQRCSTPKQTSMSMRCKRFVTL